MKDLLQLTCIINGRGHSSDKFKVLIDFGSKYTKSRPTNERSQEPAFKKSWKT